MEQFDSSVEESSKVSEQNRETTSSSVQSANISVNDRTLAFMHSRKAIYAAQIGNDTPQLGAVVEADLSRRYKRARKMC